MCGSGTILIEAAHIACRIPASIHRDEFAFMNWKDYDAELYSRIYEGATSRIRDTHFRIMGTDKAPSAVRKSMENIKNAGLEEFIKVERQDFFSSSKPTERHLHLLTNPPYGERISIDPKQFYAKLGDTLKQGYPDTDAWLITAYMDAIKYMGLRPSRKIKVFNGKLESRLLYYPMYAGSKKARFQQEQPE
jgi:putative N6-adenine-specific DNA methylase